MKKPTKKQLEKRKKMLARRVRLLDGHKDCKRKSDFQKYGTNKCTTFGLETSLGEIIANNLFQYIADASEVIIRDDWNVIEKHAQAILDFSRTDCEYVSDNKKAVGEYMQKAKAFREAMFWLTENWERLWW
jgi:hypothetical protein